MTRFKAALLDELVAHTQAPVPAKPPFARLRRRVGGLVAAAVAGVVAAAGLLLVGPFGQASYAVETHPDGTVSITFRELADPQAATRDLRAAGVRAQVVNVSAPGTCPAVSERGRPVREPAVHVPDPREGVVKAFWLRSPPAFPTDQATYDRVVTHLSTKKAVFRPSALPPGAVIFITQSPPGVPQFTGPFIAVTLTKEPAPTCWAYEEYPLK